MCWRGRGNVRHGHASAAKGRRSGLAVLDVDRKNGKDGMAALRRLGHGPAALSPVTIATPSGGLDAVKLGRMNLKGDRIAYRRRKTARTNGVLVSIPVHPDLAAVLADLPNDRPFLATAYGKGRSPDGLGNLMREWWDKAGLPECSAHGLRKACARRLAEAGASAHEIMAVTGHKTLVEVERYTVSALREGMADSAFAKLLFRPNRVQTVVNLPSRFAKNPPNVMKTKGN